ncbi:MAG: hypothetical protein D3910_00435 [Candidatus Electrothrix sp. ATG2]|nr:hypothetical protein [Candidatus Electrothrix sp. ATG2]
MNNCEANHIGKESDEGSPRAPIVSSTFLMNINTSIVTTDKARSNQVSKYKSTHYCNRSINKRGGIMRNISLESGKYQGWQVQPIRFFEKFVQTIINRRTPNYIESLNVFFDKHVVSYFFYEVKEVFPLLLKADNFAVTTYVKGQKEGQQLIMKTIAEFKDYLSFYNDQPTREQVKRIIKKSELMVRMILAYFLAVENNGFSEGLEMT